MKEFRYIRGDLVWRNQKKATPGVKCKISRHWTGPWIITEKICDVLFKLQHAENSPPVVVHGDNIKPYNGTEKLDWFQSCEQTIETVVFPCLRHYRCKSLETTSEMAIQCIQNLTLQSVNNSQYASLSPASCLADGCFENMVLQKQQEVRCDGNHHEFPFPTLCQVNGTCSALTSSRMDRVVQDECRKNYSKKVSYIQQ